MKRFDVGLFVNSVLGIVALLEGYLAFIIYLYTLSNDNTFVNNYSISNKCLENDFVVRFEHLEKVMMDWVILIGVSLGVIGLICMLVSEKHWQATIRKDKQCDESTRKCLKDMFDLLEKKD